MSSAMTSDDLKQEIKRMKRELQRRKRKRTTATREANDLAAQVNPWDVEDAIRIKEEIEEKQEKLDRLEDDICEMKDVLGALRNGPRGSRT